MALSIREKQIKIETDNQDQGLISQALVFFYTNDLNLHLADRVCVKCSIIGFTNDRNGLYKIKWRNRMEIEMFVNSLQDEFKS